MVETESRIRINESSDLKGVLKDIEQRSGEPIHTCYQCGNCSASCPAAGEMDYTPRQVMRALQIGQIDEVLHSSAIWTCLGCQTCVVRCPRQIEVAKVMDTLREKALAQGVRPKEGDIYAFHQSFLQLVKGTGRLYEMGLILLVNLRTGKPFANLNVGLPMLAKGKVSLIPERSKSVSAVNSIFQKVAAIERSK